MESQRLRELGKSLATKISRRRALAAAAGSAGGSVPNALFNRQGLPAAGAARGPVIEAGRRLTAAVAHEQDPLPTVHLPIETEDGAPGQ